MISCHAVVYTPSQIRHLQEVTWFEKGLSLTDRHLFCAPHVADCSATCCSGKSAACSPWQITCFSIIASMIGAAAFVATARFVVHTNPIDKELLYEPVGDDISLTFTDVSTPLFWSMRSERLYDTLHSYVRSSGVSSIVAAVEITAAALSSVALLVLLPMISDTSMLSVRVATVWIAAVIAVFFVHFISIFNRSFVTGMPLFPTGQLYSPPGSEQWSMAEDVASVPIGDMIGRIFFITVAALIVWALSGVTRSRWFHLQTGFGCFMLLALHALAF